MTTRAFAGLRLAFQFDLSNLRWLVPVRLAVGVTTPMIIGQLTGHMILGVAGAIGAFICGCADTDDALHIRARVMLLTSGALGFAALIGGYFSESHLAIILISVPIGGLCAFSTALGPNAGTTGMLTLVVFTIYAGSAVSGEDVLLQALAVLCGGLLQTAIALAGWPFHRFPGMRGSIADVWRSLAVLSCGPPEAMFDPTLPSQLVQASRSARSCGAEGASRQWLFVLIDSAQSIRLPLSALSARRRDLEIREEQNSPEYKALHNFALATSDYCRQVARALVWIPRRKALPATYEALNQAAKDASSYLPDQVKAVMDAIAEVNDALSGELPIGRRGTLTYTVDWDTGHLWDHTKNSLSLSSPIMRHAIRVAIAIPLAWIIGYLALTEHQYWVALTVAWVARPGYGMTFGRVTARVIGTLVGLVAIAAIFWLTDPGIWGMILIAFVSSYFLFAFLPVNYGLAIVLVTMLVVSLLEWDGESLEGMLENRGLGTILGGILTIIISQIGRSRAGPLLPEKLAKVVSQTRSYCAAIVEGSDWQPQATALINARRDAVIVLDESRFEKRGLALPPERAELALNDLLICIFFISAMTSHNSDASSEANIDIDSTALDADLQAIYERLSCIQDGSYIVADESPHSMHMDNIEEVDSARAAAQRCLVQLT